MSIIQRPSPTAFSLPSLFAVLLGIGTVACTDGNAGTDSTSETGTTAATTTTTTNSTGTSETTQSTESSTVGQTSTAETEGTSDTDSTGTSTSTGTDTSTTTGGPICYGEPIEGDPELILEEVAKGFDRPLFVASDPSDPERLFVVEQGGHIKILEPGMSQAPAEDFLFVETKNANANTIGPEQGLLGFAFHPDFPTDPRVYINYNPAGNGAQPTVIDEYKLDADDPNKVDPNSRRTVIAIHQPKGNHNGGMIAFGDDGYLYIGMGDGGGANDGFKTGRDPRYLLAKVLRIDVEPDQTPDSTEACENCPVLDGFDYTIPADNPFVGMEGVRPEIWALGVRNPWRMSFDPETGWLYAADVGQGQWEEVDIISGGADYGWSAMEGNHCFNEMCDESAGPNQANADGLIAPLTEYNHSQGRCSITGGAVYRGCEVPAWSGRYFYGDYC
ncbi:MAG TPA: hypothetical protein ENJ18_01125, partial [Nannocystis exedens]|nr:hypothetical protein [Nannocystis exedens]